MCLENNEMMTKRNQGYNGMGSMGIGNGIFGRAGIGQPQSRVMGMGDLAANGGFGFMNRNPKQTVKTPVAKPATPTPVIATGAVAEQPAAPATPAAPAEASAGTETAAPIADMYAQAAQRFYFNPRRSNAQRVVA